MTAVATQHQPGTDDEGERTGATGLRPGLSRATTLLFAVACGLAVANVYYAQPLLDEIARSFGIGHASVGIVVTVTQVGYGAGLLLLVPLGDVLDRRRLIVTQSLLSVAALIAVATASSPPVLLAAVAVVGLLAVVTQVLVAFAATLSAPADRGHVVGVVTSGVVLGILLARVLAGGVAELAGWRAVYLVSAGLTLLVAAALFRALPTATGAPDRIAYPALLRSTLMLFRRERLLRVRALIAFFLFAAFSTLWTSLVLPLSAPPLSLSPAQVGLFGLIGAAGALGALRAGRLADRGRGQQVTGVGLALLLVSWVPIGLARESLLALVVGLLALDLGVQAVHVTNQSLLYAVAPEARSRLTAAYMVFYSLGSAVGSIASTAVYAWADWTGVCLLGAGFSAAGLGFWALTRRA